MHVLLIIAGVLLLLFGGGCSLLALSFGVSTFQDFQDTWPILLFGCVLPLVAGYWLVRAGVRLDHEKLKRRADQHSNAEAQNWPE